MECSLDRSETVSQMKVDVVRPRDRRPTPMFLNTTRKDSKKMDMGMPTFTTVIPSNYYVFKLSCGGQNYDVRRPETIQPQGRTRQTHSTR